MFQRGAKGIATRRTGGSRVARRPPWRNVYTPASPSGTLLDTNIIFISLAFGESSCLPVTLYCLFTLKNTLCSWRLRCLLQYVLFGGAGQSLSGGGSSSAPTSAVDLSRAEAAAAATDAAEPGAPRTQILFRLHDGQRTAQHFPVNATVQQLFDFVEMQVSIRS